MYDSARQIFDIDVERTDATETVENWYLLTVNQRFCHLLSVIAAAITPEEQVEIALEPKMKGRGVEFAGMWLFK
jgi:hypothetical protein